MPLALSFSRKFWSICRIYLLDCFAYPAASIIWVFADAQTAIILPAVWLAAGVSSGMQIGGMGRTQLITYYLVSMTISQFVTCYLMWDIAWDIREGTFTSFLIRPIPYFQASLARNLSWRVSKAVLFLPFVVVVYACYLGLGPASPLHFSVQFWLSLFMAHTLSFMAAYALALTAFWTVEFMSVLRLYMLFELMLSGRMFPISALPGSVQKVASFLHFRYTNAFPVEILMGRHTDLEARQGLGIQAAWIIVFYFVGRLTFRRGVRRYTGVGM